MTAQRSNQMWFDGQAEEAARFCTSVFNNSKIGKLSPRADSTTAVFLVVFQATDQAASGRTFSAEQIQRPGQPGAKVTVGNTVYEVTFALEGPPAGRIQVAESGKRVLDRALANRVAMIPKQIALVAAVACRAFRVEWRPFRHPRS